MGSRQNQLNSVQAIKKMFKQHKLILSQILYILAEDFFRYIFDLFWGLGLWTSKLPHRLVLYFALEPFCAMFGILSFFAIHQLGQRFEFFEERVESKSV